MIRRLSNRDVVGVAVAFSLVLAGCTKSEDKPGGTATTSSTTTTATTTTATTTTATNTAGGAGQPGNKGADKKPDEKIPAAVAADGRVAIVEEARKKIKLGTMPDSQVIVVVGDVPITIGDYRRQLKSREEEMQASLSADPNLKQALIEDAKKNNISLTADEKQRLLETAKKAEAATGKALTDELKRSHQTMDKFNDYVLEVGLAFKDATFRIEENLLHQLVDRALLTQAARTAGFGPAAFQYYVETKKRKVYQELLQSGFTADQIKDEVIANDLVTHMVKKIQSGAQATDSDIEKFYKEHQDQFKHSELIQVSQIVIAAPPQDIGGIKSIRSQVLEKDPKLTGAALEEKVKAKELEVKKKAEDILARALKGEDFAKLSNDNTDDIANRAAKLGGDMGYREKDGIQTEFASKVSALKVGQVYPSLIPSPYGYFIVKLTGKKPAGIAPLSEMKDKIAMHVSEKKADEALQNWLLEKRRTTKIAMSPEFQALVTADTGKGNPN